MSVLPPIGCQQFDERADDLALGLVDEPERSQLLAHAAGCTACQALLDGLGTVVDRLLLTAPQVEPPAGFESRALARFAAVPAARRRVRAPLWAVACIALVVGAFGFVLAGVLDGGPNADAARHAAIVSASGAEVGVIQLVGEPQPHVLITYPSPNPNPGVRHCELQLADGSWVEIGTWEPPDVAQGAWAVGVTEAQLTATAMRVTNDAGETLATASFD